MSKHGKLRVDIRGGDIVEINVDAIVNAANDSMMAGAGVDGAIRAAAGPQMDEACRRVGHLNGMAKVTPGFDLRARWVIHVAAPMYGSNLRSRHLADTFELCILKAQEMGLTSIAFPLLGAGAYRWNPVDAALAARIAVDRVSRTGTLRHIVLVAHSRHDLAAIHGAFSDRGILAKAIACLPHPVSTRILTMLRVWSS